MCAEYLAENFEELLKTDKLMELDCNTWAEMLKSDEIKVTSEEEIFKAVMRYANRHKETRDEILETILPSVRFPLLSSQFLVEVVEIDRSIQHLGCLHQLLHETYRYKAYPSSVSNVRTKPRKGSVWFDTDNIPPGMNLSDDNRTASVLTGQAAQLRTIKVIPSFNEGVPYREFKMNQLSQNGFWVGLAYNSSMGNTNTYPGQVGNSWGYEATGGQLYYSGAITSIPNGIYHSGDKIGILCNLDIPKLEFYKNGQLVTTVANFNYDRSSDTKVFPYLAFYNPGDSVTIVQSSGPK